MNSKIPNTPLQTDDTAKVTLDEILDSQGNPVGENTITYDLNVTVKGTAAPNTALWIRDKVSRLTDVTSGPASTWTKQFTLTTYGCYSLSAIEKNPPQDFSSAKKFTAATKTPIINTVIGENGPIANGAIYYGDSVDFTGNADPATELTVFDDVSELEKTATVDACGLFGFKLDTLEEKEYKIKFQAARGEESTVFTFTKESGTLTIDDVLDEDDNSIAEGETTAKRNLTVKGKAKANSAIKLLGGVPSPVPKTADGFGVWEHTFTALPSRLYSITAQTNDGSETTAPRTFTVRSVIPVTLDQVTDTDNNPIAEGGTTSKATLIIEGKGEPNQKVQILDNDVELGDADVSATGDYQREIGPLPPKLYNFVSKALYPEGGTAGPYRITVALSDAPVITSVLGAGNEDIKDGGTTKSTYLTIRGDAASNEMVKLLGITPPPEQRVADNSAYLFFIQDLVPGQYVFIVEAMYGGNPQSNTFTVTIEAP